MVIINLTVIAIVILLAVWPVDAVANNLGTILPAVASVLVALDTIAITVMRNDENEGPSNVGTPSPPATPLPIESPDPVTDKGEVAEEHPPVQ